MLSEEGLFWGRGYLPNLGRDREDRNKVLEEGWSQMRAVLRGGGGEGMGGYSTVMCAQLGAACCLEVRSAKRECFGSFQLFVDAFVVFFQVQERAV